MPNPYQKVLKEVLAMVRPKPDEKKRLTSIAKKALAITKNEAKKFKAKAMLAGSITRDTWLPGKMEFDVFILFPANLAEKRLEDFGLEVGKKVMTRLGGRYRIDYAQHPYVSGDVSGVSIDIVPCFDVKDPGKMKSAVDRTPFHVKYIEKHLPSSLSNDVRLLKQFCKANNIYGADAKTQGLSGYVCELLVIRYGGFVNALKNAVEWLSGHIVDIEGFYFGKDVSKLGKSFKDQTIIIIDPTDPKRNTAAAISAENFFKFRKLAGEFIRNPSNRYFLEKEVAPITEKELMQIQMKRRTELLMVKFAPPDVVPDILWPQLRRFADRLQDILEEVRYEFKVLRKDSYTNEKDLAVVLLEMEVSKLPSIQKRIGPKVSDHDDSQRFIEKYKSQSIAGPFVEGNYWVAEVNRKFLTARDKLTDTLSKDLKVLEAKGIPNFVADQIAKGFEVVFDNDKIMELVRQDPNFGVFLRKYFEKESLV